MKRLEKKRQYWYIMSYFILFGLFGLLHSYYLFMSLSIQTITILSIENYLRLKKIETKQYKNLVRDKKNGKK